MNQQTQIIQTKQSALSVMASRFSVEPAKLHDTLKETVFKGASNEELMALVVVANQYGLNPFTREIYAFPKKGGGIQPVISIDGWLTMMNSHPQFDGIEFEFSGGGADAACTATIYVKGRSKPVRVTEYLDECRRNTEPWNTCPRRMLRHKATIQAARVAFGFSGALEEDGEVVGRVVETVVEGTPAPERKAAEPTKPAPATAELAWQDLERELINAGLTFDQFREWAGAGGHVKEAESLTCFEDVPPDICKRLIRAKSGMIQQIKGGAL